MNRIQAPPKKIQVTLDGLRGMRARLEQRSLIEADWSVLTVLLGNYLDRQEARAARLAAKAEKLSPQPEGTTEAGNVESQEEAIPIDSSTSTDPAPDITSPEGAKPKKPRKGHGRLNPADFKTATHHQHSFANETPSRCDRCHSHHVRKHPTKLQVVVAGQPSLGAEVHEIARRRCVDCGRVMDALSPSSPELQGIGKSVIYAPSACAMILVMHYVASLPFKRTEALHRGWGIPLSDAMLYQVANKTTEILGILVKALAAYAMKNGLSLLIDDTGTMVVSLQREIKSELEVAKGLNLPTGSVRTGINATGVIIETPEGRVVMYHTGRHHAGEVVDRLMKERPEGAPVLVKVSDGASKNFDHGHAKLLIEGICNAHAFLKFHDIKENYPVEYKVVGEAYHQVFLNDAHARQCGMSARDRLIYHQKHSTPWMNKILEMCRDRVKRQVVEPNSLLWDPVVFIINGWDRLTLFLREPGVPLDTNIGEQSLIVITRYLAASFFYKNKNGAETGDIAMSVAATAKANGLEPVAYITHCLKNEADLRAHPEKYFPWACREAIPSHAKPPDARAA